MKVCKCTYTCVLTSTFAFHFWVHHPSSTQRFGSFHKISVSCLSLSSLTLLEVPFQCPAVTLNIMMNFRHMNKMLTIMAFTQLCLWDGLASLHRLQLCVTICPSHLPCSIWRDTWAGIPQTALYSMLSTSWNKSRPIGSMKKIMKFTHKQSYSWLHWEELAGRSVSQTVDDGLKLKVV